jgi:hypothetical protein
MRTICWATDYLREDRLPAANSHLGIPGAGHGSLVDVGAAHDDVGVVDNDHLAVHVDHLGGCRQFTSRLS